MALEYKSVNIDNDDEAEIVELLTSFGWELKSSQRVYNQDTHLEYSHTDSEGRRVYDSVTDVTDFTKLVFQRDKSMENYDEICEWEEHYFASMERLEELQAEEDKWNQALIKFQKNCDVRSPASRLRHHIAIIASIAMMIISRIVSMIIETAPYLINSNGPYLFDNDTDEYLCICFNLVTIISLIALVISILTNFTSKRAAYQAMRDKGTDSPQQQQYRQQYEIVRQEFLQENPDIAKLENDRPARMEEMRRMKSEASKACSRAERLL